MVINRPLIPNQINNKRVTLIKRIKTQNLVLVYLRTETNKDGKNQTSKDTNRLFY